MNSELAELLRSARIEILRLRKANELLGAQMSVVNVFAACVGLRQEYKGECVDVAWQLEQTIERIEAPGIGATKEA